MLLMASAAVPEFDTVTLEDPLSPTTTVPNAMVEEDSVTVGEPAVALPEPLRAMICGEPVALSVIVIVAL